MIDSLFKAIMLRLAILAMIIFAAALILDDESDADDYASAMVGVFHSGKSSLSETKLLNLGYRDYLFGGLCYQIEGGGWFDVAGYGRSGSAYAATQVGVEAGDTTVARVLVGPALITSPDAYLGGAFQFTEDFFIGIKGTSRAIVGIKYKHFSSAGLEMPNVGRDFMGIEASIPF